MGEEDKLEYKNYTASLAPGMLATKIIVNVGVLVAGFDSDCRCIIYARPTKSEIRWLQTIGRGLRKSDSKEIATLYDISDDLTWKNRKNFTIIHFVARMAVYNEEKFDYKIYPVNLKA